MTKTKKQQIRLLAGVILAVGVYYIYKEFAKRNAQSGGTTGGSLGGTTGGGTTGGSTTGGGSTGNGTGVGGINEPIASQLGLLEVVTTSGSLNIRKEKSVNAPVVGQLAKGQRFYTELIMGGGPWYSVLSADKKTRRGYVSSQFTKFVDDKPNSGTPSNPSTPSNPASPTQKYQVTTSSGALNMREQPNATSKIIGTLAKGTIVQGTALPDGKWIKVTDASGKTGYASAQFMQGR